MYYTRIFPTDMRRKEIHSRSERLNALDLSLWQYPFILYSLSQVPCVLKQLSQEMRDFSLYWIWWKFNPPHCDGGKRKLAKFFKYRPFYWKKYFLKFFSVYHNRLLYNFVFLINRLNCDFVPITYSIMFKGKQGVQDLFQSHIIRVTGIPISAATV